MNIKRAIARVFGKGESYYPDGILPVQSKNRNTKHTRERREMCLKLRVRTSERAQWQ